MSPGFATGVGSLPGVELVPAAEMLLTELPEFPHFPELPMRGPWFDMVGRGCATLVDLPVQHSAGRWSLVRGGGRGGSDLRRARSGLTEDAERFAELLHRLRDQGTLDGKDDPVAAVALKLQMCGPITLATCLELPSGQASISDGHALADIAASLADGVRQHVEDISRLLPDSLPLVVQVDEPALPAARQGMVPTASGLGRHPALATRDIEGLLKPVVGQVIGLVDEVVVHCCAQDPPVLSVGASGASALSVDLTLLDVASETAAELGHWLEAGNRLFAGVPVSDPEASVGSVSSTVSSSIGRLMGSEWLAKHASEQITFTPPCGLANVTLDEAERQYQRVRKFQQDVNSGALA